jgi:hypothetical protein
MTFLYLMCCFVTIDKIINNKPEAENLSSDNPII